MCVCVCVRERESMCAGMCVIPHSKGRCEALTGHKNRNKTNNCNWNGEYHQSPMHLTSPKTKQTLLPVKKGERLPLHIHAQHTHTNTTHTHLNT